MSLTIRQIGPEDAKAYQTIRLIGLDGDPSSFASDAETERAHPLEWYAQSTKAAAVFLAFADDEPIGMAGLVMSERPKTSHIGTIFGVYVRPESRRCGVAADLMDAVIAHARTVAKQVHLGVAVDNCAALKLYHRLGFQTYGTEPRALNVDGRFIDEHLMVRFLDKEDR
ncbi:GNAT family N-acetyltransferase [Pelagibacterium sp.]|uniref:GNAT family N-acetyltransferase n=1 Tax=Pelagibacterium sp. TaxID=1967288 RepID=UPI003A955BE5